MTGSFRLGFARVATFARALARDAKGNTLAIMAAAVIPLAAMIGSGVDMSRTYMVKSRLQQACDAGALAGRRAMTGTTLTSAASTQADNFFKFNFPNGVFGTNSTSFTPAATSDGQLTATAKTTLPMTIMGMFGKQSTDISVSCEARYEISNADVMFVLDVTGSMNCAASDTSSTCSNNGNVEKSNARIKALRLAVVSFYDTLNSAVSSTARLRIGFVPYASGVNVGGLLPASYLRDSAPYQSRVANYTTPDYVGTTGTSSAPVEQIYASGAAISKSKCTKYGRNESFDSFVGGNNPVVSGGPPPASTTDRTYYNNTSDSAVDWGWSGAPTTTGNSRSCRRYYTDATTTYTARYAFTNWTYRQETYDTASYKAGGSVTLALGKDGTVATSGSYNAQQLAALTVGTTGRMGVTTTTSTWSTKCIEERDTVPNATFSTIPSTAYDLDIDLIPSSDATRWRPVWSTILFDRNTSGTSTAAENTTTTRSSESHACPKAAAKLAVLTHNDVYNYVNASDFKAISNTYHDIGLIWGGRLLSPTGIFGSENNSAPNGKPISRHLIFMTDGDMLPNRDVYGMYGIERLDRRVTGSGTVPTDSDLKNRHNSRFSAICSAIKGKNITLWVVAYAQSMTTELQNCADSGKAYYASNDAELTAQFNRIAAQIAELRLSQ